MTARWQLPIRSKTETHRVLRTKEGRVYYIPFEDADGMTGLEFFSNLATVGLWTYYLAKLVPFMNHFLPAGIFFLVVAVWQNEASSRWPLRFLTWALFWGALFASNFHGYVVAP